MKVALFTQDMSGGTFGAVFSGLASALAANGVAAIELLTVQGDMARCRARRSRPRRAHRPPAGRRLGGRDLAAAPPSAERAPGRADRRADHPQPRRGASPAGWRAAGPAG